MKVLFDTHSFIWWATEPTKLSELALTSCQDKDNILLLSVASVWEMQIKLQLGKLTFKLPLEQIINNQRRTNGVRILTITLSHVLALQDLPLHHKDPFDRLLIAQATVEQIPILSADSLIGRYPIKCLW